MLMAFLNLKKVRFYRRKQKFLIDIITEIGYNNYRVKREEMTNMRMDKEKASWIILMINFLTAIINLITSLLNRD